MDQDKMEVETPDQREIPLKTRSPTGERKYLPMEIAARNEIITVEVGPDRREYKVHKAPLIEHSEYFKNACKKPWIEQQEGVIRLDDIDPETFGLFVQWIYTQKLAGNAILSDIPYQLSRINAVIFGDRFLAPEFSKAVRYDIVRAFIYNDWPHAEVVIHAYENLPADDPLLNLLADVAAWFHSVMDSIEDLKAMQKRFPKAFLFRFMLRVLEQHEGGIYDEEGEEVTSLPECDYHGHKTKKDRLECPRYNCKA